MESLNGIPVFCVETKVSEARGRKLYINFKSTDKVEQPDLDLDEDQLVQEICNPSPSIENFKIPLKISQIYWTNTADCKKSSEGHYVIDVHLNDKFAIRRLLVSDVIRHYVIIVTMLTIEEKYNSDKAKQTCGQFIGHRINLDQAGYEVLTSRQCTDKSNELVNNKIVLIGESEADSNILESLGKNTNNETCGDETRNYDLYFRPASELLTCSLQTDKLPDSISFNEDRIIIKSGDKCLMDVHLPFFIDLKEPVKYKFDDKLCLFRAVFKTCH